LAHWRRATLSAEQAEVRRTLAVIVLDDDTTALDAPALVGMRGMLFPDD
jgi:hypothetical protein